MASQPAGNTPMERLVDAMAQIRDRCVWTQAIDHDALVPYLIEESYELVEAIETGTRAELVEELGDVLWQVLFHAEIASRAGTEPFDLDDVAQAVLDKMVPRHPHVFGDEVATTPEEVMTLWFRAKAAEKSTRTSVLDGIPRGMPALALADKVLSRAAKVGVEPRSGSFEAESAEPAEPAEPAESVESAEPAASGEDAELVLGRQLLGQVDQAHRNGLDAERALRLAIRELEEDVRSNEAR